MKLGWMAAALLAAGGRAQAVEVTASIVTKGPACTYGAKKIASSIFRKAGVTVAWRAQNVSAPPVCLVIELEEQTPDERLPGALGVSHPYQGCSQHITVFLDRVRARSGRPYREAALLAYVLVHEIAHVLQGTDRHSNAGIMKARWTDEDYAAILERRLAFLDEDVLLMRRGNRRWLAARPNQESPSVRTDDERISAEGVGPRDAKERCETSQAELLAAHLDILSHHLIPGYVIDLAAVAPPMAFQDSGAPDQPFGRV
jgi:hypothetical protein